MRRAILLSLSVLICITALIATTNDMRHKAIFGISAMLASADLMNHYLATILQGEKVDSQSQFGGLTESGASATEYFSASASLPNQAGNNTVTGTPSGVQIKPAKMTSSSGVVGTNSR